MRWRFVPALLSLALLGSMTRELGGQGRGQDTRPGIAVLPFDNSGSYGQDKENFDALQKGIAGMLISELAANPAARVVEREEIEKLLAEQSLGASGKVTPETAAKIGKLVGARYVIAGTFIDFYGDFRLDARLVNVETSEIVKVESDRMQRDHLFDIIRTVAARLMKDTNLPPLPRQASDQRTNRQIPTEALTFYSKAILEQERLRIERQRLRRDLTVGPLVRGLSRERRQVGVLHQPSGHRPNDVEQVVPLHAVRLHFDDLARLHVHQPRVQPEVTVEIDERSGDDVARADELPDLRRGFGRHLARCTEALLGEQLLDLLALDHAGRRIGGELRDEHTGDALLQGVEVLLVLPVRAAVVERQHGDARSGILAAALRA